MKKQWLMGVALGVSLSLSNADYANSVLDGVGTAAGQKSEQSGSTAQFENSSLAQLTGSSGNRLASESAHDVGARWSWIDQTGKTEIMAFTSTAAANNAAILMGRGGESLSFSNFGRVPFYQMLTINNQITSNSPTSSGSRSTAALPEPTTLTLLGVGLAALAAGLRKKNPKSSK